MITLPEDLSIPVAALVRYIYTLKGRSCVYIQKQ